MKPKHMQEIQLKNVMTPAEKSVLQKIQVSSLRYNISLSISGTRVC